ncbi:phage portal protein [Pseudonocardia abyssalis]|uniref:Phage portal protein n=1 Tax=Pseudonocardia abyssalis TaxID=2792008 RepID=A0ABS6UX51_9PSEU|nr:phage portal protein [Pseudonocardia abyssalis]MBW0117021.1 phage portal protein [Pseudonocardia abyssalis]MBW0136853.1 phage portal protein [Pseudonocardia abyssalis]
MGWWTDLWADEEAAEKRSVSIADPAIASLLGYPGYGDGPSVSEHSAMTLSAVFRAVSLVSGAIGSLPLRTLETDPATDNKVRASSFLDRPGLDRWTTFEWKELVTVYLLLHGAAPLQHIYGGGGQLIGLNPIHPHAVQVEADADVPGGRRMTVRLDDGTRREFDATTMTYIPGLSLDGVRGISPITLARLSLGTGLQGDRAANRLFSNGSMVSGVVTPEDDLTEDEARVVKDTVNRAMTGVENAGDIAVINRKLKFQQWSMSAADAQFLESRVFSIDEVGRWFGVPPHLLGLTEKSTSWGQGIAEQNRGLARYTLTPWTNRIEQRLSPLISSSRSVEFDYTAFVQPSPEDEITLLISQVNAGLLTLNEARRIRNLPPLPGPDADLARTPPGAVPPSQAGAA